MFEEEDEPLEVGGFQFAVDTVEWMSHRVGDVGARQIALKRENIVADNGDVSVLLLGNAPDQQVDFARILREICGNLFTYKRIRQDPCKIHLLVWGITEQ